uniref:Pericentrin/AKAP-450 centrosomal targeting domain-containing protein n=1 Tax=Hucho hucho TaxID=62062 RepID=A0A4W5NCG0_9TELE
MDQSVGEEVSGTGGEVGGGRGEPDSPTTELTFARTLRSGETVKHDQTYTIEPDSEVSTTAEDYSSEEEVDPVQQEARSGRVQVMEEELAAKTLVVEALSRELEEFRAAFGTERVQQLQDFAAALKQRDGIITQLTTNLQQSRKEKDEVMREFLEMTEQSQKLHIQFQQLQAGETLRNTSHSSTAQDLLQAKQQLVQYQQQLEEMDNQQITAKAQELETCKSDLDNCKRDLESTKDQLNSCRVELESSKVELESSKGELDSFRFELESSKGELESCRVELESCRGELSASRQKERMSSSEIQQLMGTVEDLQKRCHQGSLSECDTLQRMEEDSARRLDHLRTELDEMYGEQIVHMKQDLRLQHSAALECVTEQHRKELELIKAQQSETRTSPEVVIELKGKIVVLQQRLQEAQALHEKARQELSQVAQEKLNLQGQVVDHLHDLRSARAKVEQASQNIAVRENLQGELQRHQATIDDLKARLATAAESAVEIEAKHESETTNYKIKLEMMEREKDAVLDRMAESQEAELERLRTQLLFSHEEELILLREDLHRESQLNAENLLNEAFIRHGRALEELRNAYKDERDELLHQIFALKDDLKIALNSSKAEELVVQLKELQVEVEELREGGEERVRMEREIQMLLKKNELLENQFNEKEKSWDNKWREQESEKRILMETNNAMKEEVESKMEKIQSFTTENEQKQRQVVELQEEIEKQRNTFSFAEKNFEVNYQELKEEYMCLVEVKLQLDERILKETFVYESKLASLQSQIQELREKSKMEDKSKDNGGALIEKYTTELMEKLKVALAEKEELAMRLSEVTRQLTVTGGELDELEGELSQVRRENKEVIAQNENLEEELERERETLKERKGELELQRQREEGGRAAQSQAKLQQRGQPKSLFPPTFHIFVLFSSFHRNLLRKANKSLRQVLSDVLKTTAAAEETIGCHVVGLLVPPSSQRPTWQRAAGEPFRPATGAAGESCSIPLSGKTGADDVSVWSGETETDEGLELSQQMMTDCRSLLPGAVLQLENEEYLMNISSRLQAAVEKLLVAITETTNQLEHAQVTQTELMRESFHHNQEIGDLLRRQEDLQERLGEEGRAREQLAPGAPQGRGSRLHELEQERLQMQEEREILSRQQDAMREHAGPRELHLLEETEKLMAEKVEVQRQAEKESLDLLHQVKTLEAELEEQVNRVIELEHARKTETGDLLQQIQALEKQLEKNRRFLDEQAIDREHERDVFQQEILKLEQQLKNSQKQQPGSEQRSREVDQLTQQLREKADWCSELLLASEQLQREADERNEEIDKLEGRIRELEQALLASTETVEDKRQDVSVSEPGDSSLEAQLQTEREALDRKEKEISNLEEQLEQFREELENKSEEVQQLHMQLEIQRKELSTQQQDLETKDSLTESMSRSFSSSSLSLFLHSLLCPSLQEINARDELLRDLESQVECMRSEQQRLKRNSEEELEQLNAVIDKLQEELANIERMQFSETDEELKRQLENQVGGPSKEEYDEIKQKMDLATLELDTIKAEHCSLLERYRCLQENRLALAESEKELSDNIAMELQDALREKTAAFVVVQAQIQALEQNATSRVEELSLCVQKLEGCVAERDSELTRCRFLVERAQEDADDLQRKVQDLEDKLRERVAAVLVSQAQLGAIQQQLHQSQESKGQRAKESIHQDPRGQMEVPDFGFAEMSRAVEIQGVSLGGSEAKMSELHRELKEVKEEAAATKEELSSYRESYAGTQTETFSSQTSGQPRSVSEEEEVEEMIGEYQEKIVQMQELHAAEILDMEARHIAESEALKRGNQILEEECKALKTVIENLQRSHEVSQLDDLKSNFVTCAECNMCRPYSKISSEWSQRTGYDLPNLQQEFRTTPEGARKETDDALPDRIKNLLREVHQEGMQVLSLSALPIPEGEADPASLFHHSHGWPKEREALLATVESLKALITQIQTHCRETQVQDCADWRGELLGAVQQVFVRERSVLKSAAYARLDLLDTSDAIIHLNQLEHRLAEQVTEKTMYTLRGGVPESHILLQADRALEELKGELAQTKLELSQTKLELETTLKAQYKHLKELDTVRTEMSQKAAEVDTLADRLADEHKKARELQWAFEKEKCKSEKKEELEREELEVRPFVVKSRRGGMDKQQEAASILFSSEREAWTRERSRLEKGLRLAQAEVTRLRGEIRTESLRDMTGPEADNVTLKKIYGKYLRSESFRKALIYQKKYLLLLLGGFQECEEATLSIIARMGCRPSHCSQESLTQSRRGLTRFRSAVRVSIALSRMRFLVKRWHKTMGMSSITSVNVNRNGLGQSTGNEVRADSPYLQPGSVEVYGERRGAIRGRTGRDSPRSALSSAQHRFHMAGDPGPLTCSHLQNYDPDRALTDYISRLEALQRRLGSVQSGSSSYAQLHFGIKR